MVVKDPPAHPPIDASYPTETLPHSPGPVSLRSEWKHTFTPTRCIPTDYPTLLPRV